MPQSVPRGLFPNVVGCVHQNNLLERIRNISRISTALAITRKVLGIISLKAHEALITAHQRRASVGPSLALESPSPCPGALRPCSLRLFSKFFALKIKYMLQLRALRPYTIQRGIGAVLELYQYALYWH
jgi:hypothetical protein